MSDTAPLVIDIQNDYFPGGQALPALQVQAPLLAALDGLSARVAPAEEILKSLEDGP